jgi:predicted transcriptional regulator
MQEKAHEKNSERAQDILKAAKAYLDQTGNANHIPVQTIEQSLGISRKALQAGLKELETNQKIEAVEKSEQGQLLAFKLTHWTIRNNL